MTYNRVLIILIVFLVLIFVSKASFEGNYGQGGYQIPEEEERGLKTLALAGDKLAYNKLVVYYGLNSMYHESFLTSFIVANKYENAEAYFELYYNILHSPDYYDRAPDELLNDLDKKSRCYALYYLLKSYESGYHGSKSQWAELFGKKAVIPKSGVYLDSIMLVSR